MAKRLKISDSGPIACRYKIAQFREDKRLAAYKDNNFCSNEWLLEKKLIIKQKRIGLFLSSSIFIILLLLSFFICIIEVA